MTDADLRYAINEMFARRGGTFGKQEIRQMFEKFSWYRPRTGVDFDHIEQVDFTDIEKANVKLLGAARDAKPAGKSLQSSKETPKTNPAPAKLNRPGPKSQVITYRGLGNLVNQKLGDTWLYGDMMLLSWESPRAQFVSWAQFMGARGVLIEVEFAGGCQIGGNRRGELPNPGEANTPLFCPTASNPIQLTSVALDQSGRMVVKARSADGFKQ
jgi:hypothetical protein